MKKNKCFEVRFQGQVVRTMNDKQERIERMCLDDICKILRREDMIKNGKAIGMCPSSMKIGLNGSNYKPWFVYPTDLYRLTRKVRKDSDFVARLCDQLDEWISNLKIVHRADPTRRLKKVTEAEKPVVFTYNDNPISFKADNGRTYINATEMARTFGKLPDEWLRLAQTTRFRESLVTSGKFPDMDSQIVRNRGRYGSTWIEESLAMEFSRWLSPDFSEWCNDCIKKLIEQGYVSLKENKPGSAVQEGKFAVPKTLSEALRLAAEQHELIEQNRHKVEHYDKTIENRDWFKSSSIADELDITAYALHQFLEREGICRYVKKQWRVTPSYQALQTAVPNFYTYPNGKTYQCGEYCRWTPAGREYIIELWQERQKEQEKI